MKTKTIFDRNEHNVHGIKLYFKALAKAHTSTYPSFSNKGQSLDCGQYA